MSIDLLFVDFNRLIQSAESVHRLRRFILDLAVRGKLAPQDPNDEPASELLKRIAAEKARLVKAGAIGKPKQFPAIDEPPYPIPDSWRWLPIRAATSDRAQCVPQTAFTYIDVTAIDKEKGFIAKPKVLQANEAPSRARKIVRVCQKTPLSELSCHDPPHFPRQLQPNFVQEDASDRSGWGDWWWTGPDLRDAAIGRRSRLLGSGFKG